jgi:AI-2 transport protein TqsA
MATRSSGIAQSVTATAAGMALLYFLRDILIPLVLALFLAVLVNALIRFIGARLRGAPRWTVLVLAALVVIIGAVAATLIFVQGAAQMVRQAPGLIVRIEEILQQTGREIGLSRPLNLAMLTGKINIPGVAGEVLGGVGGLVSGLLLMITYFIFLLAGQAGMQRKLAKLSPSDGGTNSFETVARHIAGEFETYMWVQTVTGIIIAALSALIMFVVGLDNVAFWTIVLFLLCYIPMLGVTVGSLVPALFALLQFSSWWQAAVVFGGIQVIAFIVGNFIYPRMQAESQNIAPVATLLSLAFWGSLWGLTGAFLAVPLTLMVMMICAYFPRTRWVAVLLSNDGEPAFPERYPNSGSKEAARDAAG